MPGDQVKTDRRDAKKLARFLRSGDLRAVWIPDAKTEALRDLSRCRSAARDALHAARQQLSKFLLRHGMKFDGKAKNWGTAHLQWIEGILEMAPDDCVKTLAGEAETQKKFFGGAIFQFKGVAHLALQTRSAPSPRPKNHGQRPCS